MDRPILSNLSGDPSLNAIKIFFHHASVLEIKEVRDSSYCFSFKLVTMKGRYFPGNISVRRFSDMPTKFLKGNSDIFSKIFQANLNITIETSTFPAELKYADVKPVFKNDSRTEMKNYRPISILPNVSENYEKYLNK